MEKIKQTVFTKSAILTFSARGKHSTLIFSKKRKTEDENL
jgi:hypothetical protein